MIREALAGRRILLTGTPGFLGRALFERLLVAVPVGRIDVIIRGDARARLGEMLESSVFSAAVTHLGRDGLRALVDEKVRPISADLTHGAPPVADDIDLVIHAAATVSFDPPIDEAFDTNLRASVALCEAARGRAFVHVSTAYVAGSTKGTQREELLERDVDWRAEADAAAETRMQVEAASRTPDVLQALLSRATDERGRVGPQATARRAEELRREWIQDRLIDHGRTRARTLGWPDVYTFSKALTEIALDEIAGDGPLTIVRPSIIESALEHPYPGWIEGFRMAEPVILAFGRGVLPEFTGFPEGVVDIIPVDRVVNGVLASAARAPEHRAVYHISSGARNPLRFRELYEHTRDYFLREPLPERGRGAYRVPEWRFPGSHAVMKRIAQAEKLIRTAESVVARLPRNRFARDSARRIDRLRTRFDFAKRYASLYGPYSEVEAIYTDDRAREMWESLPEEDRRDFPFDPIFEWKRYLQEVHLPAVTLPLRWMAGGRRPQPEVRIESNGREDGTILAVFDVEGTIVNSNVVEPFLWLRLSELEPPERVRQIVSLAARAPGLLRDERRDRGEFLRRFYRLYAGVDAARLHDLADEVLGELVLRRLLPGAVRRIRAHRAAGHRIILITASLDLVVRPVGPLADVVVAGRLAQRDGYLTGDLETPPMVGEARAAWLEDYARDNEVDLAASYGYADSMTDLPMLETVGNPVAVNAEVALARRAREGRWPMEEWPPDPGTPRLMLPEMVR